MEEILTDEKQKAWIGVDPGKSGAYAFLRESGTVDVYDWTDARQFAADIREYAGNLNIIFAVIESVHSMPKQGVSSSFSFGMNYGMAQGVIMAMGIPIILVSPQKWQKAMLMIADGKNTKEQSLTQARRMFPAADIWLKKHHGRSDAALLAEYGRRTTSF